MAQPASCQGRCSSLKVGAGTSSTQGACKAFIPSPQCVSGGTASLAYPSRNEPTMLVGAGIPPASYRRSLGPRKRHLVTKRRIPGRKGTGMRIPIHLQSTDPITHWVCDTLRRMDIQTLRIALYCTLLTIRELNRIVLSTTLWCCKILVRFNFWS